jgi:hypothetical protein
MRRYLVTRKKTVTVTLTGTSGTANINIGGTNYLATFNTSLTVTADDFRTTHAAAILSAKGVVVTDNDAGVLTFTANVSGISFTTPTVTNATGNLAGTVAQTKAQTNFELFTSAISISGGGNVSVFQIKDRDLGVFVPEGEKIKRLNYHEGELITLATSENFTLVATDNDGSGAVTIKAES